MVTRSPLRLAAAAVVERPDLSLEEAATQPLIEELTRLYLNRRP